jgi:chemotaxis signal transduction protein
MSDDARESALLERLRDDFDKSFAKAARSATVDEIEILGLGVGDGAYAVRLADVAAVHEIGAITRVPGRRPGFDGLTTAQGQLVAVYDLARLVAAPGASRARRWLLVARADAEVGFAVDAVEGYRRVASERVVPAAGKDAAGSAVRSAIDEVSGPRLLVDLEALVAELRRSLGVREGGSR